MTGKEDSTAAGIEANEEAGVKGNIATSPVGSFEYFKDVSSHDEAAAKLDDGGLRDLVKKYADSFRRSSPKPTNVCRSRVQPFCDVAPPAFPPA